MESHFRKVYHEIRLMLTEPDKAHYILHTPLGAITIKRMSYKEDLDYVFIEGLDDTKKYRLIALSEAQIASLAFEIRPKSAHKSTDIGFRPNSKSEDVP